MLYVRYRRYSRQLLSGTQLESLVLTVCSMSLTVSLPLGATRTHCEENYHSTPWKRMLGAQTWTSFPKDSPRTAWLWVSGGLRVDILPAWFATWTYLALAMPSSASVQRVFSVLKRSILTSQRVH
jgi:hypothetical protein